MLVLILFSCSMLISFVVIVYILSNRFREGTVINVMKNYNADLFLISFLLSFIVLNTLEFINIKFSINSLLKLISMTSFYIAIILIKISPTKIIKDGIILPLGSIIWDEVESYGWHGQQKNVLEIKYSKKIAFISVDSKVTLRVINAQKDEIDLLLKESVLR